MKEARESLGRIDEWLTRLGRNRQEANVQRPTPINREQASNAQLPTQKFEEALDDDLNISAALGFLFESIRETNRAMDENKLDAASAKAWLDWWKRINTVLDLEPETEIALPAEVAQLAEQRVNARREKNWKGSDELRDRISALGWDVRDTKDGQKLRGAVSDPGSACNRRGICARATRMIHSSSAIDSCLRPPTFLISNTRLIRSCSKTRITSGTRSNKSPVTCNFV